MVIICIWVLVSIYTHACYVHAHRETKTFLLVQLEVISDTSIHIKPIQFFLYIATLARVYDTCIFTFILDFVMSCYLVV